MWTGDARRSYHELAEQLRSFVARRVPACDVDDVLQDVFLRVQCALPSLREEERFAPWIYRIAHSAIVESHRQRARRPAQLPDEALGAPEPAPTSEPSPLEQELASYMLPYIARLPSPYREALTLSEIEGLTQKAAADALGISLSAMKSRVQRGREKLRAMLEACCRIALDARGHVIECEPRDPKDCRCKNG